MWRRFFQVHRYQIFQRNQQYSPTAIRKEENSRFHRNVSKQNHMPSYPRTTFFTVTMASTQKSYTACPWISDVPHTFVKVLQLFLGAFAIVQKATISFVIRGSPSLPPHGTSRLLLDEFPWNLILSSFRKSVEKIQVSFKSDKNTGHFTSRTTYILCP
jgi:hypothetical protein